MAELEDAWARITAWLAANAPASYATLRPPAPAAELEACEEKLGFGLPSELRRLLLVNDGASDRNPDGSYHVHARFLPGGHQPLSAARVAQDSRGLVEVMDDLGFPDLLGHWWHPEWVMFAAHIAGDGMTIDQRPGPAQGTVGEFNNEGDADFTWGASLAEYLERVADSLENGTACKCFRPRVTADGRLDWDVVRAS